MLFPIQNGISRLKVHVFKEGHKNWQNLHRRFDNYFIMSNRQWRFFSNFVAFLENIIFNYEVYILVICLLISSLWNFCSSTLTSIIIVNFLHHKRSWPFNLEGGIKKFLGLKTTLLLDNSMSMKDLEYQCWIFKITMSFAQVTRFKVNFDTFWNGLRVLFW